MANLRATLYPFTAEAFCCGVSQSCQRDCWPLTDGVKAKAGVAPSWAGLRGEQLCGSPAAAFFRSGARSVVWVVVGNDEERFA